MSFESASLQVLLSHIHFDAVGGLVTPPPQTCSFSRQNPPSHPIPPLQDYIREFQSLSKTEAADGSVRFVNDDHSRISVYADAPSLKHLSTTVPYLFQSGPTATPVAQLNWCPLQMMEEQTICGLTVVPFTMSHHRSFDNSSCIGSDCTGFVFNQGTVSNFNLSFEIISCDRLCRCRRSCVDERRCASII